METALETADYLVYGAGVMGMAFICGCAYDRDDGNDRTDRQPQSARRTLERCVSISIRTRSSASLNYIKLLSGI